MINSLQAGAMYLIISIYVKYSMILIFGATKFLSSHEKSKWRVRVCV